VFQVYNHQTVVSDSPEEIICNMDSLEHQHVQNMTMTRKNVYSRNTLPVYYHSMVFQKITEKYSWFVIGRCCNFHGINSTVEIAWDLFRIRGSAGRICQLENVKSYMSHLQRYTKIIKISHLANSVISILMQYWTYKCILIYPWA
jgi:hypothetical protein